MVGHLVRHEKRQWPPWWWWWGGWGVCVWRHALYQHVHTFMQCTSIMLDPSRVHKNCVSHIDVSHSRQPLVKGERLVRYEVNTVIHTLHSCRPSNALHTPCSADALMVQVLRFPCDASFPSPPPQKKRVCHPRPTLGLPWWLGCDRVGSVREGLFAGPDQRHCKFSFTEPP